MVLVGVADNFVIPRDIRLLDTIAEHLSCVGLLV